jgi:hypothetical protein
MQGARIVLRVDGISQVVERLPSKGKALSSNLSILPNKSGLKAIIDLTFQVTNLPND